MNLNLITRQRELVRGWSYHFLWVTSSDCGVLYSVSCAVSCEIIRLEIWVMYGSGHCSNSKPNAIRQKQELMLKSDFGASFLTSYFPNQRQIHGESIDCLWVVWKLNHVKDDSLIAEEHYSYPCADCLRLGRPAPEKEMTCRSGTPRSPAVLHINVKETLGLT